MAGTVVEPPKVTNQTLSFVARTQMKTELTITSQLSVNEMAALTGANPEVFSRRLEGLIEGIEPNESTHVGRRQWTLTRVAQSLLLTW